MVRVSNGPERIQSMLLPVFLKHGTRGARFSHYDTARKDDNLTAICESNVCNSGV
jgi:hypothetical protein